jgi:hypothetical protein
MLMESSQIAMVACVLSVGFAALATPLLVSRLGSSDFPAWLDVAPNAATVGFAVALSFVTALLFGIVPALRASASSPDAALKSGGSQHSGRVGAIRWMLATEIGFSVAVLFLSGLLPLSFQRLMSVDLGFTGNNVVLFDLASNLASGQPPNPPPGAVAGLLEAVRNLPGVQSIGAGSPDGGWASGPFRHLGTACQQVSAGYRGGLEARRGPFPALGQDSLRAAGYRVTLERRPRCELSASGCTQDRRGTRAMEDRADARIHCCGL